MLCWSGEQLNCPSRAPPCNPCLRDSRCMSRYTWIRSFTATVSVAWREASPRPSPAQGRRPQGRLLAAQRKLALALLLASNTQIHWR